jgi:hypothetical protein
MIDVFMALTNVLMVLWLSAGAVGLVYASIRLADATLKHTIDFKRSLPIWRELHGFKKRNPQCFEDGFVEEMIENQRKARLYDATTG